MLSLTAIGIPASGPGLGILSTRAASASSSSCDQCSVAFNPSALARRRPVSAASVAAPLLTDPPLRHGVAPGRTRPETRERLLPGNEPAPPHLRYPLGAAMPWG